MPTEKVRVRFAPSPTGPLHIGGVRTALYNYLYAKKNNGDFILRIEDTDQNRFVEGAEDYIIEALNWCGIPFDEGPGKNGGFGPYRQSERKNIYKEYAEELVKSGNAYYAFDSAQSLEDHRKDHEIQGKTFIYNWHNRQKLNNSLSLSEEEVQQKFDQKESFVVRFKNPESETLELKDEIRGNIRIETNTLDDKVLFKSDGMPTYHLANIVDDHLMEITHVIRGEEWLPSLPLHVLLYRALDWKVPRFAHLPLILKPEGKGKLSKRDGDKMGFPVFPLEWKDPASGAISAGYREEGYYPEAVINMLAHLGWNEGGGSEKEFYSLNELSEVFSLEHVSKGGSKFDPEKTKWFQHHYLQQKSAQELAEEFKSQLNNKGLTFEMDYIIKVIGLLKERASFVSDFWSAGSFFFVSPVEYDQKALKKAWKDETATLMKELIDILEDQVQFNADNLKENIKSWINSREIGFGKIMQPLRISLVGTMQGPDLFEIAACIGKDETVKRIQTIIDKAKQITA